ncbi:hypothetical protein C823_007838 [Eubacterium plexicaudatum ASF492]|uniref:mRNA interferase n=1 Tax=Eubacterium plexicaudatum ASF492 TaxID=1235802 RepID=N1ZZ51_9FIRM|nr:hypothetical protein C823_007838 [Eubacterium plexicaudatum ASF492]
MTTFNKYDVIFGEFPDNDGSIQSGYRPGIVIQNNIGNKYSPTLIVMPLTSRLKNLEQATHLFIKHSKENGLKRDSILLAEQISTINKEKAKKIGHIEDRMLQKDIFKCFIYSAAYGERDADLKELKMS